MPDRDAFEEAKRKIVGADRQRSGIGTLSEKTVHSILKNYFEPDENRHEIPMAGYVADICKGSEIIEIQTRQFDKIRGKLGAFLPLCPVTVVYPISREKWVIRINEESGETAGRRKSPVKGNPYTAFPELYRIKMFLKNPNFRLCLVLMDVEEYKLAGSGKRGRKNKEIRYDCIPIEIVREIGVCRAEDYMQFVPPGLGENFTSRDFAKEARISVPLAQVTLNILHHVGTLERVGKRGRMFLYGKCGSSI